MFTTGDGVLSGPPNRPADWVYINSFCFIFNVGRHRTGLSQSMRLQGAPPFGGPEGGGCISDFLSTIFCILYYTILCYIILYYIIFYLYYIVLYYIVLYYIILYYIILYYIILYFYVCCVCMVGSGLRVGRVPIFCLHWDLECL
jgi:hypothetical protein